MPRPTAFVPALLALAALASSCSHYRLGTGPGPDFRSLHLPPVRAEVLVPQGAALLSTRLREAVLRDGRLELRASDTGSDTVLTVTLTEFRREIAAARADDTGLARKFNLTLGATCTLRDTRTGRLVWDGRKISVRREVFTDSGQLQAEYQALALLTEALAARISGHLVESW